MMTNRDGCPTSITEHEHEHERRYQTPSLKGLLLKPQQPKLEIRRDIK